MKAPWNRGTSFVPFHGFFHKADDANNKLRLASSTFCYFYYSLRHSFPCSHLVGFPVSLQLKAKPSESQLLLF
ncbi:hypothetical protein GQ457_07G028000 [Hibiscus cannabinus]